MPNELWREQSLDIDFKESSERIDGLSLIKMINTISEETDILYPILKSLHSV